MKFATPLVCTLLVMLWASASRAQPVFVSSRNTHSVKQYDLATGNYLGDFVLPNSGGLSYPQEVVWHPDGFLLVTGRGNTAVKKYDSATGAYLGNFTSGYLLDNPTKTTIWRDSLLFVSQWGTTQNKIVRFDLKTGAFVDEFTSTGVPNGCGHAWDIAGNLLVAQYGNGADGKVLKFDANGVLTGTFVTSSILQGPVNLWFDMAGNLLVADWTLGEVLRFDGVSGAYLSKMVTGMFNVEGFDFDDDGHLYLCDWTANKVFKYDFDSNTLTTFAQSGGLQAPNSILIREAIPASTAGQEPNKFLLSVAPNPSGDTFCAAYVLEKTASVRVRILNSQGQLVATLFSGEQTPGEHRMTWTGLMANGRRAQADTYFVQLSVGGEAVVKKIIWQ